jgi:hypothetical protein
VIAGEAHARGRLQTRKKSPAALASCFELRFLELVATRACAPPAITRIAAIEKHPNSARTILGLAAVAKLISFPLLRMKKPPTLPCQASAEFPSLAGS